MNADLWPDPKAHMRLVKGAATPGHRTRVLLVDHDPAALAVVRSVLRAQDWEVLTAKSASEALDKARLEGPDAILTELHLPDMPAPQLCTTLRQRPETAATPIIILSASTGVAERVACLRAGASDYLVKPPDAQELIARIRAALDLRRDKAGFVIAVVGAKGGVGASLLAVNLAVALRQETRLGVALLDAASHGAAVDVFLNLQTAHSSTHLLPQLADLEETDFETLLTPHATGIQALLLQQQGLTLLDPTTLRKTLVALRRLRDLVVVDTSPVFDDNAATVLELADRVLLVLAPEIPALRGARLFLEQPARLGLSRERIVLVLNRFPMRGGLQRRDIENTLGIAVHTIIPDDVKLVGYSVNRGVPIVESHRRSRIARQIAGLAKTLAHAAQQQ